MPQYFRFTDPGYFDAMTPPEMRWSGAATREVMPGWDLGSVYMGDDLSDPEVPVASLLQIAPGDTLHRHAHDCFRVEVVVRGSITVPGGQTLVPGDVMVSRPGEFYGPHIAGPDGCLSVEIFSAARGVHPIGDPDAEDARSIETAKRVNEVIARLRADQAGR
ncbi:anti-sigma factor ChrR (cupin superfamily) [Thermocatellispora tengchongensis]|uniref:Anti-sigma factor ChrR (Cupin superfamily) n=1 Tax=Thermocatellispora tengchongensis TaxID=1073253 RepID=A0A840PKW1_9ACTN|nr:hypothetical protein [Thermocatellispora tengchongensis]MBB5138431.1 anti-sigma factor ChrR (cupin superfamily) [Thermocatellispora tengchongensis]